jgi:hypothetical protein
MRLAPRQPPFRRLGASPFAKPTINLMIPRTKLSERRNGFHTEALMACFQQAPKHGVHSLDRTTPPKLLCGDQPHLRSARGGHTTLFNA